MADKGPKSSPITNVVYIGSTSLLLGICFGFALEKGHVFEPQSIVDQMLLHKFQMMKMFLSAVGTSMLGMSLLSFFPYTSKQFTISRSHIYTKLVGFAPAAVGAAILGAGMSICGACPGTVVVQAGAGVSQAFYVLAGGLLAGSIWPSIQSALKPFVESSCPEPKSRSLDSALSISYAKLAIPIALGLGLFTFTLEKFFPWRSELPFIVGDVANVFTMKAWPPYVAGAIVGLLNIPAVLALNVSIGSASSYEIIPVNLLKLVAPKKVEASPYLKKFTSPISLWQPTYLFGACLGAFLSSYLSGTFGTTQSLNSLSAFIGGFVLIFGARLAGGCTSGHGISGFSNLWSISFLAVPFMFIGGIATAYLLKSV